MNLPFFLAAVLCLCLVVSGVFGCGFYHGTHHHEKPHQCFCPSMEDANPSLEGWIKKSKGCWQNFGRISPLKTHAVWYGGFVECLEDHPSL